MNSWEVFWSLCGVFNTVLATLSALEGNWGKACFFAVWLAISIQWVIYHRSQS